jgi:flavin-dependent dehydrogenase
VVHRAAVIGGGHGGAAVAKALESEARVVLIDPRDAPGALPGEGVYGEGGEEIWLRSRR